MFLRMEYVRKMVLFPNLLLRRQVKRRSPPNGYLTLDHTLPHLKKLRYAYVNSKN
jgi:hypothetical protein